MTWKAIVDTIKTLMEEQWNTVLSFASEKKSEKQHRVERMKERKVKRSEEKHSRKREYVVKVYQRVYHKAIVKVNPKCVKVYQKVY